MISDAFWLNMGAEVVYKSLDNQVAAVERLQRTIVWIFGIYSTITIGSAVFVSKESWSSTALMLFGLAFLFLIISYWVATTAAFLRIQDFYGNAAESIRNEYLNTVNRSAGYFKWAVVLCSLGVLLYGIALFIQFSSPAFVNNRKAIVSEVDKVSDSLQVQVKAVGANTFALQIHSRKNSWINYMLLSDTTVNQQVKTEDVLFTVQSRQVRTMWLYIDTSTRINEVVEFSIRPNRKYHLFVFRTDTSYNGSVFHTIRKKITLTQ